MKAKSGQGRSNNRKQSKEKKRAAKVPKFEPSPDVDEEIHQHDVDFFNDHQDFSGFLVNLDANALSKADIFDNVLAKRKHEEIINKAQMPAPKSPRREEPEAYEVAPRKHFKDVDIDSGKLPIRDSSGSWQKTVVANAEVHQDGLDQTGEEEVSVFEDVILSNATEVKADDPFQSEPASKPGRPLSYQEKIEKMAAYASSIIEDPQEHYGRLKHLRNFASDSDIKIVKLALLTQMTVYRDIIPGYRVRRLSEKEKTMRVSKDIKLLRQYEESLVANYQSYLKCLEDLATANAPMKENGKPGLLAIAVQCMCELLKKVSHFNFRSNLMTSVVTRMNMVGRGKVDVGQMCCDCVAYILRGDESGHVALEVVEMISQLVKKNLKSRPRVVDSLLHLQLSDEIKKRDVEKKRRDRKKHVSKRNKKVNKVNDDVEAELKEAAATIDFEEKLKTQSETLKHLFVIYFRILKADVPAKLLCACLTGIRKFGHLISIDYFENIVKVIRGILNDRSEKLSVHDTAECINTCFFLYNLQDGIVAIDLKDLFGHGYRALRESYDAASNKIICGIEERESVAVESICQMIELMFCKRAREEIVAIRAAAYIKRLFVMATKLAESRNVLAVLFILKTVLARVPMKVQQLLVADEDERPFSSGVYNAAMDTPDLCNPFSASLSEVDQLKKHVDKAVGKYIHQEFVRYQK